MGQPKIRILDDGEIDGGIPEEWDVKPKKKRPRRWRRLHRIVKLLFLITPVILVTVLATLVATEKIDLNQFEIYRRLCFMTLGPNRLLYSTYGTEDLAGTFALLQVDPDSGRTCATGNRLTVTSSAVWSPDGNHILYDGDMESSSIRISDVTGSDVRTIIPHGSHAKMSLDGKRILYTYQTGNMSSLFVADVDGAYNRQLHENISNYFWLPDNASLILTYSRTPQGIFKMNLDGTKPELMVMGNNPVLSPDGKLLAFTGPQVDTEPLFVSDLDGSNKRHIGNMPLANRIDLAWSPDSRYIAFTKPIGSISERKYQIDIVDLDTSSSYALTNDGQSLRPVWSPDGKRIAFIKVIDASTDVYVINADGTNPHKLLSNSHIGTALQWRPQPSN
jgi:Tol biopolymer transport system component